MPRCLMAKKWKAYPWPDRSNSDDSQDEDEKHIRTRITTQQPIVTSIPTKTIVSNNQQKIIFNKLPNPQQQQQDDDEEIDVVGVGTSVIIANTTATSTTTNVVSGGKQEVGKSKLPTTSTCWGPSSPTEGTTAPSPPPHLPEAATRDSTTLYNGKSRPYFFSANGLQLILLVGN